MGVVDLCARRSGAFSRLFAVKRLHPHLRDDDGMRAMFLDEARLAGLIRHANVVSVLDFGEDTEGPFLVMDYVEGLSLSRFVRHHAKLGALLPVPLCARIGAQIACGLHAAHELVGADGVPLQLVHRDVSPQNILIGHDGLVRVTDFGIAKGMGSATHTSTGLLKGKVGYMSPEQLRFEPIDRRSDLFALGVVLFELLTSRRLYAGDDASEVARRILHAPPPDLGELRPDADPELVELLFELLAKQRDDRPASAAEIAVRLDLMCASEGVVDLGAYVQAHFGTELAAERTRIQTLAGAVAATPVPEVATIDTTLLPRPPRSRWPLLLVGAVATALMVAVLAWPRDRPEPATAAATGATAVTVHIDSEPPGARVTLAGAIAGVTPLRVEMLRGDAPVPLLLELDGFAATRRALVPSDDERLLIALSPAPAASPAGSPAASPAASPADSPPDSSTVEMPPSRGGFSSTGDGPAVPKAEPSARRGGRRRAPEPTAATPTPMATPRFRRFQ